MFHFHDEIEEKLRNNRWHGAGHRENFPTEAEIFPELEFARRWRDFRQSPDPLYLDDARYWWEYARGIMKPSQYDPPGMKDRAPDHFAKRIYFGALPGDDIGPADANWEAVRAWLLERHARLLLAFERDYARMPVHLEGTGQQETLRLLPPGVRRVIKGYADRIQAVVQGRILWDQILGCGHFGCVVPIEGSNQVLKVTTDATEGPVVQAIINTGLDKELAGLVRYHEIWQIPGYEGRGARSSAYAIVRDGITPMSDADIGFRWIDVLHNYNVAARRELDFKREHMVKMAREQAEEALAHLYNWNETYFVAEAIEYLRQEGIILSDVHFRNLGMGQKSPDVSWADGKRRPALLIFDPGHSRAPQTEVKLLP